MSIFKNYLIEKADLIVPFCRYGSGQSGFTLAEVLITLSIIGVIASMTIPSLVQDIQDAQFKTALKKSYSTINQATIIAASYNGGKLKGLCADSNCIMSMIRPYLNYTKACTPNAQPGCWHLDYKVRFKNNTSIYWNGVNPAMILNDGSILFYRNGVSDCSSYGYSCFNDSSYTNFDILTDVNGFKGPNTVGKDIFYFHILANIVKPFTNDDCNASSLGVGCASKYLYQ